MARRGVTCGPVVQGSTSYELPRGQQIERAAQRVYERLTARLNVTGSSGSESTNRAGGRGILAGSGAPERGAAGSNRKGRLPERGCWLSRTVPCSTCRLPRCPFPGRTDSVPLMVEHEIVNFRRRQCCPCWAGDQRAGPNLTRRSPCWQIPCSNPTTRALTANRRPSTRKPRSREATPGAAESGATRALRDVGFLRDGTLSVPRWLRRGSKRTPSSRGSSGDDVEGDRFRREVENPR